ncbi:MAG: hypothetical protein R2809_10705 [Flavobacteriales bacterium]
MTKIYEGIILSFYSAITLLSFDASAQQNFYQKQNRIFGESSCNQWMVKELTKNFPAQFSKNTYRGLTDLLKVLLERIGNGYDRKLRSKNGAGIRVILSQQI